mgnify:CR=1 FL=1
MDIETFYRYVLLAETKSVSRAAEQGYLSRQTLSDSMTKLEQELGIRLFIRRKRGLELTEAGEELLRFLKGWLPEWEQEPGLPGSWIHAGRSLPRPTQLQEGIPPGSSG